MRKVVLPKRHSKIFLLCQCLQVNRDDFAAKMRSRAEVLECYLILGDRDFLLKVCVADLEAYQKFYLEHLTRISGVRNINSIIAVSEEKRSTILPI